MHLDTNTDQYMNKRNEMKALIEINQPDIVGITEMKPKHARFNVQECEIAMEGYELFHNLEEEGRGIALLVRKEMEPTPNDRLSSTFSEHVFMDCTQGDGTLLTVGVIYIGDQAAHLKMMRNFLNSSGTQLEWGKTIC